MKGNTLNAFQMPPFTEVPNVKIKRKVTTDNFINLNNFAKAILDQEIPRLPN
jgi:hypothetical protein